MRRAPDLAPGAAIDVHPGHRSIAHIFEPVIALPRIIIRSEIVVARHPALPVTLDVTKRRAAFPAHLARTKLVGRTARAGLRGRRHDREQGEAQEDALHDHRWLA